MQRTPGRGQSFPVDAHNPPLARTPSPAVGGAASGCVFLCEPAVVLGPLEMTPRRLPMQLGLLRMGVGHPLQQPRGPLMRPRRRHHRLPCVVTGAALGGNRNAACTLFTVPPGLARLHESRTIIAAPTNRARSPPNTPAYVPRAPPIQPPTTPTSSHPPGDDHGGAISPSGQGLVGSWWAPRCLMGPRLGPSALGVVWVGQCWAR